ncbi:MAG: sulfotransferase [Pseudomonadota bacterium]
MEREFHFISGLPRSGSTMTAAVLRQNPDFHAAMSGPIAGLFEGMIAQVSAGSEMASMVSYEQRRRLLKGLFENYYADLPQRVIFDTNRSWTAKFAAILTVFPNARVICLVRDVAWIMDSMERQYRKNPFEHTRIFANAQQRATVYSRLEALAGPNSLVGFPWNALREACYADYADRLMLVDYDLLVRRPKEVFDAIYDFIGVAPFEHDFTAVDYDAPEFDTQLGMEGLHRVHQTVAPRPRDTILPPDLFRRFGSMSFWRHLDDSKVARLVPTVPSAS